MYETIQKLVALARKYETDVGISVGVEMKRKEILVQLTAFGETCSGLLNPDEDWATIELFMERLFALASHRMNVKQTTPAA